MKRVYVILIAFGLVLAACGDATTTTTASPGAQAAGPTESTSSTTTTTVVASTEGVDLGEDGVLTFEDFIPGFNTDYENIDWRAEELAVQQTVAECMAAEGFEYIPFMPADIDGGFGYEEWDEETYVKEFGFGIATWVVDERNFGVVEEGEEYEDPYADDPNMAIVEAMDEFEREEYYRLLYGGEPPIIENTPREEIEAMSQEEQEAFYNEAYADWQPDGCYNDAWSGSYDQASAELFFDEFSDDLDAMYSRVETDQRIIDAQAAWSGCMADQGHDYATQEEMYSYFYGDEFGEGEFSRQVNELITHPDFSQEEYEALTEEQLNDPNLFMPQFELEELQPYIDEEIAVATANYECSEDMFELWDEVYTDLQQQFVDENMDRLLAFLEANS